MYDQMIAITNRRLCGGFSEPFAPQTAAYQAYLKQLDYIASLKPAAIVLREKDLNIDDYIRLAAQVLAVCKAHGTPLILHNFPDAAEALDHRRIHLPLALLRTLPKNTLAQFEQIGTSVHALTEAEEAVALGADYLFAGNIYETDCKKGLPGRGLSFLREICDACNIPVYAIGGIDFSRMPQICAAGAAGGCMMSGFMQLRRMPGDSKP